MNKFKKYCIVLSAIVISFSAVVNINALNSYKNDLATFNSQNTLKSINEDIEYTKDEETEKLVIKSNTDYINNILLIGIDSTNFKQRGKSDSMMILTIDERNKTLKLTSLARDTLVEIPGYGYEKLTHSYAYGGARLLLDTIENNFKIKIDDYVAVNFNSFIDLVDCLGGVEVDIHEKDIDHLNDIIGNSFNLANKETEEPQFIRSSGKQLLNGYQTLAYTRIRKLDTIYNRDERQRQVLDSLANRLSEASISIYPKIINSILPYIDVNMSISKMIKLGVKSKELYNYDIDQLQFPLSKYREDSQLENKGFVVKWEKVNNIKGLQEFIYNK